MFFQDHESVHSLVWMKYLIVSDVILWNLTTDKQNFEMIIKRRVYKIFNILGQVLLSLVKDHVCSGVATSGHLGQGLTYKQDWQHFTTIKCTNRVYMVYCTHFYAKWWKFCTPCFQNKIFFLENLYTTVHYGVQDGSADYKTRYYKV